MIQRFVAVTLLVTLGSVACERRQPRARSTPQGPTKVLTVTGFKTPESVKYDADLDVYFVTNINGHPSAKDGNGFVSRVRPDGTVDSLAFIASGRGGAILHAPKGTAIVGDTLWVADIDAVRGFNKRTGAPVATIDVSKLARFPNDLAVGPDGALYLTDTGIEIDPKFNFSHPGPDRILRLGSAHAVSVAAEGDTLDRPNGITWDANARSFVVVSFGGPAVFSWKPGDKAPAVLARGPGSWDGVEVLPDGRIIASSWADSSVDVIAGGKADRLIGGVPSPADIGFDSKRGRVLIPIFQLDRVEIWQLPTQ
jgi:sugar lactone lactonase YvrE